MPTEKWRAEHVDDLRKYRRDWFLKNKEHARSKVKERKQKLREWLLELKSELRCVECGEEHIATLHFHHNDPSKKDMSICKTIQNGWSKRRILAEIEKCKVLCANCHSILHWNNLHE